MIKNMEPVSMAEAYEFVKKSEDNEANVKKFIKNFTKLSVKDAKEFRKKIMNLNLMKVKAEHIAKVIDLMPENEEDLSKIFTDIGLDGDETKKILEIVKEFQ